MDTSEIVYQSDAIVVAREESCGLKGTAVYARDKDPLGNSYFRYCVHVRDDVGGYGDVIVKLVAELLRLKGA